MPLRLEPHTCVENISYSRVTVAEKGKQVTFLNPDRAAFQRVKVDGCIIKNGARADWIVSQEGHGSVVVELKGRDVEHAIDQVFATVSHPDCIPWLTTPTRLLIICAKYPAFDTKVAKAQLSAKRCGLSLKVVCRTFECNVSQL